MPGAVTGSMLHAARRAACSMALLRRANLTFAPAARARTGTVYQLHAQAAQRHTGRTQATVAAKARDEEQGTIVNSTPLQSQTVRSVAPRHRVHPSTLPACLPTGPGLRDVPYAGSPCKQHLACQNAPPSRRASPVRYLRVRAPCVLSCKSWACITACSGLALRLSDGMAPFRGVHHT